MRLERLREEMDRWGEVEPHRPGDTARYGAALAEVEQAEAVIAAASAVLESSGFPRQSVEAVRNLRSALAAFGSGEEAPKLIQDHDGTEFWEDYPPGYRENIAKLFEAGSGEGTG